MKLMVILFLAIFVNQAFADTYDPTDDLMTAFGTTCSSTGNLSTTALSQSAAIKGVISSIRNDPSCQSLIPLSNSIDSDLQTTLSTQNQAAQLSNSVNDLAAAIQVEQAKGANADPDYISTLQTERATEEIQLLKDQQSINPNQGATPQKVAQNFYSHSNALLDGIASNSDCLNKHPNLLLETGAQLLKYSADYTSAAAGAVLLATGGVMDHFVQFLRNTQINSDMRDVMSARLGAAIGCSFEGLANTYCSARDLQLVINLNSSIQKPDACGTISEGTNLLSRDLSTFSDFVTAIYAGSPASSNSTASDKLSVIQLRSQLEQLNVAIDGSTASAEKNYNTAGNLTTQSNVLASLIRTLSVQVQNSMNKPATSVTNAITGPIGDTFSSDPDCGPLTFFYSLGQAFSCDTSGIDPSATNKCEECVQQKLHLNLPSLSDIETTSTALISLGQAYVNQQSALYNQNNPQLALTQSELYGQNRKRAMDFLYDSKAYLLHLQAEDSGINHGQMKKTIELSLDRINKVLSVLETSANDPDSDPLKTAKDLTILLAPASDVDYIPRELSVIVKQDIDYKLAHGDIDKNLALVLELSASGSLTELTNNYGSLESIRNQIRVSKRVTIANINGVGNIFADNIVEILKSLSKESKDSDDAKDDLGLLCIQTLLVPSAPKVGGNDISKYCSGISYSSQFYNKLGALKFDDLMKKPYEQRACSIYDFYRKATIEQQGVAKGAQ